MARDTDYILSLLLENGLVTRMQADQAADQAMLSEGLYDTVDILVTVTDTVGNDADYGLQVLSDFWPLRFTANGQGIAFLGATPANGELVLPAGTRIKVGNSYLN